MDAPWKKAVSRLNSDALVTQLPSNSQSGVRNMTMKRTISGMIGTGSLAHNRRDFITENVDPDRVQLNICYRNENLKEVYMWAERAVGRLLFGNLRIEFWDRIWKNVRDKSEVAELINLPFEEKTVILYKNKKTSIIHQFKYKVKKSINRRGEK